MQLPQQENEGYINISNFRDINTNDALRSRIGTSFPTAIPPKAMKRIFFE